MCVTRDNLVRRRGQCGLNVSHHHALHRSILVNVEMVDTAHMLKVNILQHASELAALGDGVTKPICDVVIHIAVDVS